MAAAFACTYLGSQYIFAETAAVSYPWPQSGRRAPQRGQQLQAHTGSLLSLFVSPARPLSGNRGLGCWLGRAVRDGADPRRGPWQTVIARVLLNYGPCAGGFRPPQESLIWGRFIFYHLFVPAAATRKSPLLSSGLVLCFQLLNVPETNHGLKILQLRNRRGSGCGLSSPSTEGHSCAVPILL